MSESASGVARRGLVAALTLASLVSQPGALAADAPPRAAGAPPRIGLALSGGGARGIAHVGVLKVLDEMRIPISCVTGTSMGSIVGGTFAAGRPPEKLEEIVLEADWEEIFRDKPPRDEIAMRRKADDSKTLFAPEFGVKDGGLALPKGVIAGVSIEAFFRVLAEPAIGVTDFRKLPIPFERDGDRHRDRPVGGARPRQPRAGDAREHVGARGDRAGRDRRQAAGRRRHRQQPADRPGAQALRRRDHRRQHLHAAA